MSPETTRKLEQVQRYSTSLRRVFIFAFGVVALAMTAVFILLIVAPARLDAPIEVLGMERGGEFLGGTPRVLGHVATILGMVVLLKFLYHLQKLFGLYAERKIFTAANVQQIRQVGVALLLFTAPWLFELVAAYFIAPGTAGDASIAARSAPVGEIIFGTVVIVVSWIMDVGREMREEQDFVV